VSPSSSKPKTYLVPERERTESPPSSLFGLAKTVFSYSDREVIQKCGLDAYFFLRYLKTLLVIFVPICAIVLPILIPINYVDGVGQNINISEDDSARNNTNTVVGLDTLAWGNVKKTNTSRRGAHLLMAILVVIWVCAVLFFELRVYIKVRQDYLTSAEHRLRASATTVLVNEIPGKWLSEEALRGLFDVFPGGVRNVWLNRDLSELLDKVSLREKIHRKLEQAETDLIKAAKKVQLKQRKADEKKQRKEMKVKTMSKQERAARDAEEDAEARRRAQNDEGLNAGDHHETPHIGDNLETNESNADYEKGHERSGSKRFAVISDPFAKVGRGFKGSVTKAGQNVDGQLETTNGFLSLGSNNQTAPQSRDLEKVKTVEEGAPRPSASETVDTQAADFSPISPTSTRPIKPQEIQIPVGNTVRKLTDINEMYNNKKTRFWEFWKPPTGGYASPVPQGEEAVDYMAKQAATKKTAWQAFKDAIPFLSSHEIEKIEYQPFSNAETKNEDDEEGAEWAKYLKKKDRPTHNLPLFGVQALFGIPLITKKVDTIYWCREELARLNVEIEEDQKHPERYPLMSSAFVQFEHQVAAHMACQSTMHHIPKHMTPRVIEINPRDVLWHNMNMSWWQQWARTGGAIIFILAMVLLWAIPVAFSASLAQLDDLIRQNPWLGFLRDNSTVETVAKAVAGVLPAILLAVLLALVPIILDLLANFRGSKTGSEKTEFVQVFYFLFLFVQVFLIVSIASFFAASLGQLVKNFQKLQSVTAVLDLLAKNLPKAANYFFSYMILQALSTSSGTLLQIGTLVVWFILAKILDSTARNKWTRNTKLNNVNWGTFFPVYTNFACIGIIYSVIAPLISVFAIITFSLLWVAHRYSMLYVTRFESDTGGVLYPRAINQTFTGLYFMELCLAGLFFIEQNDKKTNVCTAHGIVMLVVLVLTVIYQILLNRSFSPLFRYLPITFEDEAVLRDEAFERAQRRRFGIEDTDESEDEFSDAPRSPRSAKSDRRLRSPIGNQNGIEMKDLDGGKKGPTSFNPMRQVGALVKDGGNQIRKITNTDRQAVEYRKKQRQKDIEAQRAIGDALYGSMNDDIEDLTPDERDKLVIHAFKHAALRARRPTVWIPRDDLGISDDEIRRTQAYSEHIWISNEGTALDSKVRVVYGKNPPDFSEVDVIIL
jgi:calcium permeable stress-gated cation channel